MRPTIVFHNCDTDEARAAVCIGFLAKYFRVSDEQMASICSLTSAFVDVGEGECVDIHDFHNFTEEGCFTRDHATSSREPCTSWNGGEDRSELCADCGFSYGQHFIKGLLGDEKE